MHRYVVIGGGVAGVSAIQEIRRLDRRGEIILISDEKDPFYYRASLSEWIMGRNSAMMLPARTPDFYEQLVVQQCYGHVVHVDADNRKVVLEDGGVVAYDRLLIATGAAPIRIPIPGLEDALVYRSKQDAQRFKESLTPESSVMILGAGVLGLELAGALHTMGLRKLAVADLAEQLGQLLLDPVAAEIVQERMLADGCRLFLGDTVARVEGRTAHMRSGATWTFDFLVQAVGTRPVFPEVPGLAVGRGVQIDVSCETNLKHVYAAGDCTETYDPATDRWMTTRIWYDGARQGRTAGSNMAGGEARLSMQPFFNASYIYKLVYTSIGEPHADGGKSYIWRERDAYRKVRVSGGKLAGAFLLENRFGALALSGALGAEMTHSGPAIAVPDYPWNDLSGQDWDFQLF